MCRRACDVRIVASRVVIDVECVDCLSHFVYLLTALFDFWNAMFMRYCVDDLCSSRCALM